MHSFMRAVGFSHIQNRVDIEKLADTILNSPTEKYISKIDNHTLLAEIKKEFADHTGVTLIGEYDQEGIFHLSHYYPFIKGTSITEEEDVIINKRVDTDSYTGMSDDLRLGVSLIFYLQNIVSYIDFREEGKTFHSTVPVSLSALSTNGSILLGVKQKAKHSSRFEKQRNRRDHLMKEAKKGDLEAVNTLALDDLDLYALASRRILKEDLYSIVDNFFIPYGSESDNYTILGTIHDSLLLTNSLTGESIYNLTIECNDIFFNIGINKNDLLGEPLTGRRFKGTIWMQGLIDFQKGMG